MHIKMFRARNFRRLVDTSVDLDPRTTVFVGANNSGKTSATHIFQLFLGPTKGSLKGQFQIYDFAASSWSQLANFDPAVHDPDLDLPKISLDIWFEVDDANLHRVMDLIPSLDWDGEPVGIRLEWAPAHGASLLANYLEARRVAGKAASDNPDAAYKPWPANMAKYLSHRLRSEYKIKYYVLDASRCDDELRPLPDYDPTQDGDGGTPLSSALDNLLRVDFLHAQRHLADDDSKGRTEELSKRLSRYYARHLGKRENDLDALNAIADSEADLNKHFAKVFAPMLSNLTTLGYPGLSNPTMVVKASLKPETLLSGTAQVHYSLASDGGSGLADDLLLPDQYNGLGFKNLIYMVVEVLDFHHAWQDEGVHRAPVHVLMIEEPEAHLHAQLQQVFIRKIRDMLPATPEAYSTQMVVTTHSPHIVYERTFEPIRYFRRNPTTDAPSSDVLNLSTFSGAETATTRNFLLQYLKLTHCDLFFADAAVLVEGNVERLLLPLMIQKSSPGLMSCHLTLLEVGGAFAHKFQKLIEFLGIPTLIVTDLDSVREALAGVAEAEATGDDLGIDVDGGGASETGTKTAGTACMTHEPDATTSNQTLRQWLPQLNSITDLLNLGDEGKSNKRSAGAGPVRVAYQTRHDVTWNGDTSARAARTLEEDFALSNALWSQDKEQRELGLGVRGSATLTLAELHEKIFNKVRAPSFDKTRFALGVIARDRYQWSTPAYIEEGLLWLEGVLSAQPEPVATLDNTPQPPTGSGSPAAADADLVDAIPDASAPAMTPEPKAGEPR